MIWSQKCPAFALSLVLVGLGIFTGCEQAPPAKNSTVDTPEHSTTVTAEDVQRETAEAAHAAKEYLGEKKDEFAVEMSKKLEDLDAKMADMKVEGEKLKGDAKVKWDAAMEDLRVKREEMSKQLEELKKSSGAAWEQMKAGLEKAGKEIDTAAEDAVQKFEETGAEESPEKPATP